MFLLALDSGFRNEETGKWKTESGEIASKFPFSNFHFPVLALLNPGS
jgi:hypothetical protein